MISKIIGIPLLFLFSLTVIAAPHIQKGKLKDVMGLIATPYKRYSIEISDKIKQNEVDELVAFLSKLESAKEYPLEKISSILIQSVLTQNEALLVKNKFTKFKFIEKNEEGPYTLGKILTSPKSAHREVNLNTNLFLVLQPTSKYIKKIEEKFQSDLKKEFAQVPSETVYNAKRTEMRERACKDLVFPILRKINNLGMESFSERNFRISGLQNNLWILHSVHTKDLIKFSELNNKEIQDYFENIYIDDIMN